MSIGVSIFGVLALLALAFIPQAEEIFDHLIGDASYLPKLTQFMLSVTTQVIPTWLAIIAAITLAGAIIPWLTRSLDAMLLPSMAIGIVLLVLFIITMAAILLPTGQMLYVAVQG